MLVFRCWLMVEKSDANKLFVSCSHVVLSTRQGLFRIERKIWHIFKFVFKIFQQKTMKIFNLYAVTYQSFTVITRNNHSLNFWCMLRHFSLNPLQATSHEKASFLLIKVYFSFAKSFPSDPFDAFVAFVFSACKISSSPHKPGEKCMKGKKKVFFLTHQHVHA